MSPRVRPPPPILCLKTHAENATNRAPYEGGLGTRVGFESAPKGGVRIRSREMADT